MKKKLLSLVLVCSLFASLLPLGLVDVHATTGNENSKKYLSRDHTTTVISEEDRTFHEKVWLYAQDTHTRGSKEYTASLDQTTVLKMKLTPYFEDLKGVEDIHVYTEKYEKLDNGEFGFKTKIPFNGSVSYSNKLIQIEGFDYDGQMINNDDNAATHGSRLVFEFDIKAKKGFLGGNRVALFEDPSGLFNAQNVSVIDLPYMRVDVPIYNDYVAKANDINVYYNNSVTRADIEGHSGVKFYDRYEFMELMDWQTDYVDFVETCEGKNDQVQNDGTYKIGGHLEPKLYGTYHNGDTVETEGHINVFKPVVTVKDLDAVYDEKSPLLEDAVIGLDWKHGDVSSKDVRMAKRNIPDIQYDFLVDASHFDFKDDGPYVKTPHDFYAEINVFSDEVDVTSQTTFVHECDHENCQFDPEKGQFLVHVDASSLEPEKPIKPVDPQNPNQPSQPQKPLRPSVPQTGDSQDIYVFTIMACGALFIYQKCKKDYE